MLPVAWHISIRDDRGAVVMVVVARAVVVVARAVVVVARAVAVVVVLEVVVELVVVTSGVRTRMVVVVVDSAGNVVEVARTVALPTVSVKMLELAKL